MSTQSKGWTQRAWQIGPLAAGAALAYVGARHGEEWLRSGLLYISHAPWARDVVTQLPMTRPVVDRFVAGERIDDAIRTARELNERGLRVTMDYLGESVAEAAEAIAARDQILQLLEAIHDSGVDSNVSLKLSQMGVNLDPELAHDNVRRIISRARELGNRVRIDMEDSSLTDTTLAIFRRLRHEDGLTNCGVVIQAYLFRSEDDIRELIADGAGVRLCKGAYKEPPDRAFALKADTDDNYIKLMQQLLSAEARANGVYTALATHDERIIKAAIDFTREHNIPNTAFEFQMLYGVRRELQTSLRAQGYHVRVYVPYGTAWYPYFMRRLAERPANLWFFMSNFFKR